MLTRIDLKHFKCFEEWSLPLAPLTLLSGSNASGKSTVLQALTLLSQTIREHEWSQRLMLNGSTINLGTVADVVDQVSGRDSFEITLYDSRTNDRENFDWFKWEFQGERDDMAFWVKQVSGETEGLSWDRDVGDFVLQNMFPTDVNGHEMDLTKRLYDLSYLTAERLGPREYYQFADPQMTPVVGPRGEHAVSLLSSRGKQEVSPRLARDDTPPNLARQVEAWMVDFFPGCVLETHWIAGTNNITLGIRTSGDTDFHRPTNTGFGLTQVLPILVAALSARREGFLLIENPEVHLHPAAQAKMGVFLARVASAGVQVMIETHSDHILNGIRRAVKDEVLPCDNVSLLYFRSRSEASEQGLQQVDSPTMDSNGSIDHWPSGFFDQFEKDLSHFLGWD